MRWMEIAWENVGVVETAGPGATSEIKAYFAAAGRPEIVSDEIPWCAAFVNACLSRAGIRLDVIPREDRLLARKCLLLGTDIKEPRVGAICGLRRGSDPAAGHVGFVVGWTATHVNLLGGNQANSVSIQAFSRELVIGYRWPEPPASASEVAAKGSRITAAAQRIQKDTAKATGSGGSAPIVPAPPPTPPKAPSIEAIGSKASGLQSVFQTVESFATFAWGKWPLIALGLCAYFAGRMAYDAWIIKQARVADHNEGRNPVLGSAPEGAANDVL